MINHEDMIRYIRCTLESATTSQIEEVFCDSLAVLEMESSDDMTTAEMISAIEYSMETADGRQIEDVYWAVLSTCD